MVETFQKGHNHHHGNSPFNHHHSFKYKCNTNLTPPLPINCYMFYNWQSRKHSVVTGLEKEGVVPLVSLDSCLCTSFIFHNPVYFHCSTTSPASLFEHKPWNQTTKVQLCSPTYQLGNFGQVNLYPFPHLSNGANNTT